jgi:DNA-binding NtrC family response regulator
MEPEFSIVPVDQQVCALVVDHVLTESVAMATVLSANRINVILTDRFELAKERLDSRPPHLLVTELRLGDYNGLQLVFRGKSRQPSLAAVVLSDVADKVLQHETESMDATFVVTPLGSRELAAAAFRTLWRGDASRQSPIRPPFERRRDQDLGSSLQAKPYAVQRRQNIARLMSLLTRPYR